MAESAVRRVANPATASDPTSAAAPAAPIQPGGMLDFLRVIRATSCRPTVTAAAPGIPGAAQRLRND